ncbi:hypothetical protein ATANTOWER_029548 [Ataeniobius toweri]|uniref:Uncharacterized protein n=1 Tax=Ataeniobius toweri TaxID=208326 RepID=A0ABU7ATX0_9TELE|nr:hypothetical protein [Ataeniobius toweri]
MNLPQREGFPGSHGPDYRFDPRSPCPACSSNNTRQPEKLARTACRPANLCLRGLLTSSWTPGIPHQ